MLAASFALYKHMLVWLPIMWRCLLWFLFVGWSTCSMQSSRLVLTFHHSRDALLADEGPNISVVKRQGRHVVVDMGRPVLDVESDAAHLRLVFNHSTLVVEKDHMISTRQFGDMEAPTGQTEPDFWNLADSEPYGLHVQEAWAFTNSTPSTVVAVLDSGLASAAFSAFMHVADGYDFISDSTLSADGDGRDADFIDPGDQSPPACPNPSWHGTKVASILAAKHDTGMLGVAPNCTLLPVRVLGLCGVGYASDVADAVLWAAGGIVRGVLRNPTPSNVISMSFVGEGACPSYLQSAIVFAVQNGALVLAASGNQGLDTDDYFPANCDGVLAVAASTRQGTLASYSNYGVNVPLAAPGGNDQNPVAMLSVSLDALVLEYSMGTSFAVPQVAGVAAMVIAISGPGFSPASIAGYLLLNNSVCPWVEYGILSAWKVGRVRVNPSLRTIFSDWLSLGSVLLNSSNSNASKVYMQSSQNANLIAATLPSVVTPSGKPYSYSGGIECDAMDCHCTTNSCPVVIGINMWYSGDIDKMEIKCSDQQTYTCGCTSCNSENYYPALNSDGIRGVVLLQGGNLNGLYIIWPDGTLSPEISTCNGECEPVYTVTCPAGYVIYKFTGFMNNQDSTFNGLNTECALIGCDAGYYLDEAQCRPCYPGYYCFGGTIDNQPLQFNTCPAGAYLSGVSSSNGPGTCYWCESGYTSSQNQQTSCNPWPYCPSGYYLSGASSTTSGACVACSSGYTVGPTQQNFCFLWTTCNFGFYLSGETSTSDGSCIQCTIGYYCPAGSITQTPCAAGYYCPAPTIQLECFSGYYCPLQSTYPLPCPAGTYGASDGLPAVASCTPCPSGTFGIKSGVKTVVSCSQCIQGTYSTTLGGALSSTCIPCPYGTYSTFSAASSSALCVNCSLGAYSSASGTACVWCSAGTYAPSKGISSCTGCVAGSYTSISGSSVCALCSIGTYGSFNKASSSTQCVNCTAGTYGSAIGLSACALCATGMYVGTSGVSSCYYCGIGTYMSGTGFSACRFCSPGTYISRNGSSLCYLCAPGSFSPGNQSSCSVCGVGTFSSSSGYSSCKACVAGTYVNSTGSLFCYPCSIGSATPSGQSNCSLCSPGFFASATGYSACSPCQVNMYTNLYGSTVCTACSMDLVSDTGASACNSCPAGKFFSVNQCSSCGAGKYSLVVGATSSSVCATCLPGTTTWPNSSGLTACLDCAVVGQLLPINAQYYVGSDPLVCTWICNSGYIFQNGSSYPLQYTSSNTWSTTRQQITTSFAVSSSVTFSTPQWRTTRQQIVTSSSVPPIVTSSTSNLQLTSLTSASSTTRQQLTTTTSVPPTVISSTSNLQSTSSTPQWSASRQQATTAMSSSTWVTSSSTNFPLTSSTAQWTLPSTTPQASYTFAETQQIFRLQTSFCCNPTLVVNGYYLSGCNRSFNGISLPCSSVPSNSNFNSNPELGLNHCADWTCNTGYYSNGTACIHQPICKANYTYQRDASGNIMSFAMGAYNCTQCSVCMAGSQVLVPCNGTTDTQCALCSPASFSIKGSPCVQTIPYGFILVLQTLTTIPVFQGRPNVESDGVTPIPWNMISSSGGVLISTYTACAPLSGVSMVYAGGDNPCQQSDAMAATCAFPTCNVECRPWNGAVGWYLSNGVCQPCEYDTTCTSQQYCNMQVCGPWNAPQCTPCPSTILPNALGWTNPLRLMQPGAPVCLPVCRNGYNITANFSACVPCSWQPVNSKIVTGCNWTCSKGYVPSGVELAYGPSACVPCTGEPSACNVGMYLGYPAESQCLECLPCINVGVSNSFFTSAGLLNGPNTCGIECFYNFFVNPAYGLDNFGNPVECSPCTTNLQCVSGETFFVPCEYSADAFCAQCSSCPVGFTVVSECIDIADTVCVECSSDLLPTNAAWTASGCSEWVCQSGYYLSEEDEECLQCEMPPNCTNSDSYEVIYSGCGACVPCNESLLLPFQCFNGDGQCGTTYWCGWTTTTAAVTTAIQWTTSAQATSSLYSSLYAAIVTLVLPANVSLTTPLVSCQQCTLVRILSVTTNTVTTYCSASGCGRRLMAAQDEGLMTVEIGLVSTISLTSVNLTAISGLLSYSLSPSYVINNMTVIDDAKQFIIFVQNGAQASTESNSLWLTVLLVVAVLSGIVATVIYFMYQSSHDTKRPSLGVWARIDVKDIRRVAL